MEGKGRDDVIGIRIVPAAIRRCIIDGQQLDHLHSRRYGPINQSAKISEIPHTIGMFTPQGENRYYDTSRPPGMFLHTQTFAIEHQHRTITQLGIWG